MEVAALDEELPTRLYLQAAERRGRLRVASDRDVPGDADLDEVVPHLDRAHDVGSDLETDGGEQRGRRGRGDGRPKALLQGEIQIVQASLQPDRSQQHQRPGPAREAKVRRHTALEPLGVTECYVPATDLHLHVGHRAARKARRSGEGHAPTPEDGRGLLDADRRLVEHETTVDAGERLGDVADPQRRVVHVHSAAGTRSGQAAGHRQVEIGGAGQRGLCEQGREGTQAQVSPAREVEKLAGQVDGARDTQGAVRRADGDLRGRSPAVLDLDRGGRDLKAQILDGDGRARQRDGAFEACQRGEITVELRLARQSGAHQARALGPHAGQYRAQLHTAPRDLGRSLALRPGRVVFARDLPKQGRDRSSAGEGDGSLRQLRVEHGDRLAGRQVDTPPCDAQRRQSRAQHRHLIGDDEALRGWRPRRSVQVDLGVRLAACRPSRGQGGARQIRVELRLQVQDSGVEPEASLQVESGAVPFDA